MIAKQVQEPVSDRHMQTDDLSLMLSKLFDQLCCIHDGIEEKVREQIRTEYESERKRSEIAVNQLALLSKACGKRTALYLRGI